MIAAATPPPALSARLLDRAEALMAAARPQEALPLLDRLGRLATPPAGAQLLRGRVMLSLGRLPEAAAAADLAIAEAPAAAASLALRARVRLARADLPAALDDAAAAVMAAPGDRSMVGLLAQTLLEAGRHDEAIFLFGRLFAADPTSPRAMLGLARAFLLAGRHAPAEELLALGEARGLPTAAALRAQNALLEGTPERALRLACGALARGLVDASLHSIAGHAQVALGRLAEAAPHFAAASRLAPGNGYLAHLAAATGGTNTEAPAPAYVATLFDGYAARFEEELLGLGYRMPGLIRRAVERHWPELVAAVGAAQPDTAQPDPARLGSVLDLGCGTGLVGAALHDLLGGPLVGIDLSPRMLEQAAAKGIYRALHQQDLRDALAGDTASYQLIVAADVFIYVGRLDPVLGLCRQRLAPGGLVMFSTERAAEGQEWQLGPAGRYAHSAGYLREVLAETGLIGLEFRAETLRLDHAEPVEGWFVVARAGGH